MKKTTITLFLTLLFLSSYAEDYTSIAYLKTVLDKLDKIESATYRVESELWLPGDTAAAHVTNRYVESYNNPADSTLGASWVIFELDQKRHFQSAYDGKMKAGVNDNLKEVVIDSFQVMKLPFRPISVPFFYYTKSIIRYIMENTDSTLLEQKDLGDEIYVKLTIYADRQVEFFGKAYYMPKNPYTFDPTSIYELWIDKKSNLPRKMRREMSHEISLRTVFDAEFNKLKLENFVASDYFPKDYEISQHGQEGKEPQQNELIGKKAPDWTLQTDDKQDVSLTDLKSKVLLLQFTSVSCGPCSASIPFLKELSTEYDKSDFGFVAIECTTKNTNVLKTYKRRNSFDYMFLLSTKEVSKAYSIGLYPTFFILDENRNIINVISGYQEKITDKKIRDLINNLLYHSESRIPKK